MQKRPKFCDLVVTLHKESAARIESLVEMYGHSRKKRGLSGLQVACGRDDQTNTLINNIIIRLKCYMNFFEQPKQAPTCSS